MTSNAIIEQENLDLSSQTVAFLDAQKSWLERGKKVLMSTYAAPTMVLEQGKGSYVYDANGKKYLDFTAGIAVNSLGHCHENYVDAITEQVNKLSHCSNLYFNIPAIQLAEKLVEDSAFERAFFCNSGAEAIEGAIKLSRKYAKANKGHECRTIVSMTNSFHGRTYGALSATAQTKYQQGFQPMVPDFQTIAFNDISALKAADLTKVAALIIEPIQGEGGVHPVEADFLKKVRELCDENKVVLVFDEIQCGVGRSGTFFAYQTFGIKPDVVVLAKGLGGGFPIGAILAKEHVAAAFNPGDHGSTFGGNPLATSAALACVSEIKTDQFLKSVKHKSAVLEKCLQKLKTPTSGIKAIRGIGLMLGLEFDQPAKPIVQKCAQLGLLLVGAGDQVIRFLPPLNVTEEEIGLAISILQTAIEAIN